MAISTPLREETSTRTLVRLLFPLGIVTTLVGTANALVSPFLSLFLSRSLHADPVHASLFLVLTPASAVGAASLLGWLSDRAPVRRRLLIIAAVAGCAAYLIYATVPSYWLLLGVSVTLVALAGVLVPQVFAFARQIVDTSGSTSAPMAINTLRMLLSVSWVAGPPLAAFLLDAIDFPGLYLATAAGYAAILACLLAWLKEPPTQVAGTTGEPAPDPDTSPGLPTGSVAVARSTVAGTTVAFTLLQCAGVLGVLAMPLYMRDDLHGDVGDAGAVLGLCAALEIPLMLVFGALASRWPLRRLVLVGSGFGVAYYALASLATNGWEVAALQVLNACFISGAAGLGISYFQDLLPGLPGRATTLFTNSNRVSAMLAGPIFGLAQHSGYRLAYGAGTLLCLSGFALLAATPLHRPTHHPAISTRR